MERLQAAWESWTSFIDERESARAEAMGTVDHEKKRRLADLNVEMARLRASIASLKAEIGMQKVNYVKSAFEARWQVEKAKRNEELDAAIAEEMNVSGKSGYQLAQALGTKNINRFYNVKAQQAVVRNEKTRELSKVEAWQWSRFTGTQRYALAASLQSDALDLGERWNFVLMKGTVDTELEGKECVWDFNTGGYVSGDKAVFESDTPSNRRRRADTLAQVLNGTYAGKIKESPNVYFEEVEN